MSGIQNLRVTSEGLRQKLSRQSTDSLVLQFVLPTANQSQTILISYFPVDLRRTICRFYLVRNPTYVALISILCIAIQTVMTICK